MSGIKGFQETSFVDWPGRVCAVIFLADCNFRCPFCHNHSLVLAPDTLDNLDLETILRHLRRYKKWLGGVCISGGEPTLDSRLPLIVKKLKMDGWAVKIDTNGTRPEVLRQLLADQLLDMVSMDVKAPLVKKKYERCAGTTVNLDRIRSSISLLKNSRIEHEFRMTVLPVFHSEKDILTWATTLRNKKRSDPSRLRLQNFSPRSTMDPKLSDETPFPPEIFTKFQEMIVC